MKVAELGEFGLIDLLAKMVESGRDKNALSWRRLLIGIGDDAAAWRSEEPVQIATVDTLVQDVHFSLDLTPLGELGWKAMAVNLSDIAAMGGSPDYALVALGLPDNTEVEDIRALYRGMIEAAREFGVAIIGGNISRAREVAVTVTVLGSRRDSNLLTRSAAKAGDRIAVTGYLGTAAAGLQMLKMKLGFDLETAARLKKAFLHPSPRVAVGGLLAGEGIRAAIDISDGLLSDLGHICDASAVSARVEIERIPIDSVVRAEFGDRALELALSGGEDYELLFTGSAEAILRVARAASCPVTVIGEIVDRLEERIVPVDSRGRAIALGKTGWEHFAAR